MSATNLQSPAIVLELINGRIGIKFDSWDQIPGIGSKNIRRCIAAMRWIENDLGNSIDEKNGIKNFWFNFNFEDYRNDFTGQPLSDADYPHLTREEIMEISHKKDDHFDLFFGNYPQARLLRSGDTTFRICGWCKFCQPSLSLSMNQAKITGECSLLKDASKHSFVEEKLGGGKCTFCTECLIFKNRTIDGQAEEILAETQKQVDSHISLRNEIRQGIKKMQAILRSQNKDKPYFVCLRPHDYLKSGDRIFWYEEGKWDELYFMPGQSWLSYFGNGKTYSGYTNPYVMTGAEFDKMVQLKNKDETFFNLWRANVLAAAGGKDVPSELFEFRA